MSYTSKKYLFECNYNELLTNTAPIALKASSRKRSCNMLWTRSVEYFLATFYLIIDHFTQHCDLFNDFVSFSGFEVI